MLKGAYLLIGQLPETGAHCLTEHVYQLSSLCWSQQWEGKLTCNLETKADKASTAAATKRAMNQALASELGTNCANFLTQKKTEWEKNLPHGHTPWHFHIFAIVHWIDFCWEFGVCIVCLECIVQQSVNCLYTGTRLLPHASSEMQVLCQDAKSSLFRTTQSW